MNAAEMSRSDDDLLVPLSQDEFLIDFRSYNARTFLNDVGDGVAAKVSTAGLLMVWLNPLATRMFGRLGKMRQNLQNPP